MSDQISNKRCSGQCELMLPDTEVFFERRYRHDRKSKANRVSISKKCRQCVLIDKRLASKSARERKEKDPAYAMTFNDIGKELGISKQGAIRIYNKAISKMKRRISRE